MSDISAKLKKVLTSSAKFVSKTANSAAKGTKFKLNELSTLSKRRELISELGAKVFELTRNGLELPAEAQEIFQQIAALDSNLEALRANHAEQKAAAAEQRAAEKAARAAEKAAAKATAATEQDTATVDLEVPVEPASDMPTLNVEVEKAPEQSAEVDVPTLEVK